MKAHWHTMKLRLVVLLAPPTAPNVKVYFRFDKLFYKFAHFSKHSTYPNPMRQSQKALK